MPLEIPERHKAEAIELMQKLAALAQEVIVKDEAVRRSCTFTSSTLSDVLRIARDNAEILDRLEKFAVED